MLPILRLIPVGGVLLAIAILLLALNAPSGPHARFVSTIVPPGGALIPRKEHPEWPQLLLLAALRRAGELNKLRELPDTPLPATPAAPTQPKVEEPPDGKLAGVQPNPVDPDDVTGTVQSPNAALPVDIGESSSAELPVVPHEERPPVITMPARETPDENAAPLPTEPKPQSSNVPPAATKQASLEPGQVEPKRTIRHAAHERSSARREARKNPLPRRARRAKAQVQQAEFNLFQPFFGYSGSQTPAPLRSAPEP